MKSLKALLFALTAFSLLIGLLIDDPLQATCCKAARKSGPCGGDGVYRILSSGAGVNMANCKVDALDYYGVIFSCINLNLDTTSPPCY